MEERVWEPPGQLEKSIKRWVAGRFEVRMLMTLSSMVPPKSRRLQCGSNRLAFRSPTASAPSSSTIRWFPCG